MNTHFATGFTIVSAAAQETRIVSFWSQKPLIAMRLAARRGADDGEHLVLLDELLREGDGLLGASLRVLDDQLHLPAEDAAGLVDLLDQHLERAGLGPAEVAAGPVTEKMAPILMTLSAAKAAVPKNEAETRTAMARMTAPGAWCPPCTRG